MNDSRRDFLELVTQIRSHLEYHKALGVRYVETLVPGAVQATTHRDSDGSTRPAAEPAIQEQGPDGETGLAAVQKEITNCTRCKLHRGRNSIVFGEGNPKAVLVFVGEGPGQEEDVQGRPFVGSAGQLLTDIIVKGMKLKREDVYICNIVKCRPPDNRNPEPDEIGSCEPFLVRQLKAIGPRVIVALGNVAARTLLKTGEGITALRGTWHDYQGIPLMPTFHPAYLLRNPKDKKLVWEDIQKVMAKMKKG
jgi:DNA polymerase